MLLLTALNIVTLVKLYSFDRKLTKALIELDSRAQTRHKDQLAKITKSQQDVETLTRSKSSDVLGKLDQIKSRIPSKLEELLKL